MTQEQQVTSRRLEYCRAIVRSLARERSKDQQNFYLPKPAVRKVKALIMEQFRAEGR